MPVSASPCIQYNTEKKKCERGYYSNVRNWHRAETAVQIPRMLPLAQVHSCMPRSYLLILYKILTLLRHTNWII